MLNLHYYCHLAKWPAAIAFQIRAGLLGLFLLFVTTCSLAQSSDSSRTAATTVPRNIKGKITGTVYDNNARPVQGITVVLSGKDLAAVNNVSSVDGTFEFRDLPAGTYTLNISSVTLQADPLNVEVTSREPVIVPVYTTIKAKEGENVVVVSQSRSKTSTKGFVMEQKLRSNMSDGIPAQLIARTTTSDLGGLLKTIPGLTTQSNKFVVIRGLGERYNGGMMNGMMMPSTELNRRNFSYDIIPTDVLDNVVVYKTWTPDLPAEFGGGLIQVNIKDVPPGKTTRVSFGMGYNDRITGKDFISYKRSQSMYLATFGTDDRLSFDQAYKLRPGLGSGQGYYTHQDLVQLKGLGLFEGIKNSALFNEELYRYKAEPIVNFQLSHGNNIKLRKTNQNLGYLVAVSYRNNQSIQDEMNTTQYGSGRIGTKGAANGESYNFQTYISGVAGISLRMGKSKFSFTNFWNRSLSNSNFIGFSEGYDGSVPILPPTQVLLLSSNSLQNTLFQSVMRGEHVLGKRKVKLNWSLGYLRFEKLTPDIRRFVFFAVKTLDSGLKSNPYANLDGLGPISKDYTYLKDDSKFGEFTFTIPYKFLKADNVLKTGAQALIRKREFDITQTQHTFGSSVNTNLPYPLFFQPENDLLVTGSIPQSQDYVGAYSKTIPLYAGFAMIENKFLKNKLKLIAGARAEYIDLNDANQNFRKLEQNYAQSGTFADLSTANQKLWNFLPQAALTYSLTKNMNLRLSYAHTIVRPDIRELTSNTTYDFELGGEYSIGASQGSIIRSTSIDHFDFRYEWYTGEGDLITVTPFFKYFRLPMEIVLVGKASAGGNSFNVVNNHSTKTYGIEAEVRQSLAFTDVPVIRNLSLGINFIFMNSEVKGLRPADGRTQFWELDSSQAAIAKYGRPTITYLSAPDTLGYVRRLLTGQSNFIGNAMLYYTSKYLEVTLSYNYTSNRLVFINPYIDNLDALQAEPDSLYYPQAVVMGNGAGTFEKVPGRIDLQISTKALLKGKMEVKLNISNLTDAESLYYSPRVSEKSTALDILRNKGKGVPLKTFFFDENRDDFFSRYRTGRTFSLSIAYTL